MSDIYSSLVSYVRVSPCKSKRVKKIDTITIHCMAGNLTAKRCADLFMNKSRQCSSNYCVGSNGDIACSVPENYRSWATSNAPNDQRAITIEVANDGGANTGWHVSDKALGALVALLVDICRRNGIPMLKWCNDKKLIGQVDKQNMTVHRWFANKACPGDYLMSKHPWIAQQVNLMLGAQNPAQTSAYTIGGIDYRPVFDPKFYNARYPDLNAVYHGNPEHLWTHFVNFGRYEGRMASANFDPVAYRANNPDLVSAFGNDWPKYYEHYLTFGMAEGRSGT